MSTRVVAVVCPYPIRTQSKKKREEVVKMIFHAPHLLLSVRWLVPAIGIFGNTTNQCMAIILYRLLTLPFSPNFIWKYHRALSSQYMSLIGFFYESWSGVQVSIIIIMI